MSSKKKPKISPPRSIQEDTNIIPEAVAESVVSEANTLLDWNIEEDVRSDIFGYLAGYAEAVYANNAGFRKKIKSEADGGNADAARSASTGLSRARPSLTGPGRWPRRPAGESPRESCAMWYATHGLSSFHSPTKGTRARMMLPPT